ncbi:MAG: IS21-like element helper ATPase IstB [Chlorobiaceae bacterium]
MSKEMINKEHTAFLENCRYLGLKALPLQYESLVEKANASAVGFYEFLYDAVQLETHARRERSIRYRIRESRLPQPCKLLSDFNFPFQPKLRKKLIMDLSTMDFMRQKESILFIGDCGTGKSHLARALALMACEKGYKVFYTSCAGMLNDLNAGVYEKTLLKRMRKYLNPDLLVIDEMGHDRLELQVTKEAHLLFKVIDERYKLHKPLIFTTNVEEADWADYLGDPISTKAILDRIFHYSIKVDIHGPSYREYEGEKLQKKYQAG